MNEIQYDHRYGTLTPEVEAKFNLTAAKKLQMPQSVFLLHTIMDTESMRFIEMI